MKLAIMQPYLFPYIGYFQLIRAVDTFVLYDDVNYINKGWINRNRLLSGGSAVLFTVPLKDASQNKMINEILLSDGIAWEKKLLKTIEWNYKKTPSFPDVFPIIEPVFSAGHKSIASLNLASIRAVCSFLEIDTEIVPSSSIYGNRELKGQARIIDICQKESADIYINPASGKELYSADEFEQNHIRLHFLSSVLEPYPQNSAAFVPGLSIIDVLMNNSKSKIVEMLDKFEWS